MAGGVQLIKIWLESSDKEQKRRFEARIDDPLRQWKLSPVDLFSRDALVRLLPRPRLDAQGLGYRGSAVVHPAFRRQEARAAELSRPHS